MLKKKKLSKDQPLQDFIKSGGRSGAGAEFDSILKRAVKPKKVTKPLNKTK